VLEDQSTAAWQSLVCPVCRAHTLEPSCVLHAELPIFGNPWSLLLPHGAGSSHLFISPLVLQRVVGEEFRDDVHVCVRVGRDRLQTHSVFEHRLSVALVQTRRV
jgi:hypothetical protein